MRDSKRLLLALAAVTAAGMAGCLSSPDSGAPAAEGTQSAAVQALVGDSLRPIRPLPPVCDSLVAALATLDSTSPDYAALRQRVAHVCAVRPPRPDSLPPRPDSLRPVPPRHDSVPPVRPPNPCDTLIRYFNSLDSSVAPSIRNAALAHLRVCQAPPAPRPDSIAPPRPVPVPPKPPRPDSVIAPRPPKVDSGAVRPAPVPPKPPVARDSTVAHPPVPPRPPVDSTHR